MSNIYITTSTRTGSNNDLIGVFTATNDANYGWNTSGDSYLSGMTTTYCKTISDCNWNAFIKWAVDNVISYYKLTLTDVIYVDGKIYTSPSNGGGGTKMWTIKGEKGMTGTVELSTGVGLLWHITLPIVKDIWYGIAEDIPGTYVDSSGRDQMVAIRNSISVAFLDENYTGGIGEKELLFSNAIITNIGDNITRRVSLKTLPPGTMWIIKGEKGLTGTVEIPAGSGLLWHLVLPGGTKKDFYYGNSTAIPYTYVDSSGRDQMAVVDAGWAYFDQNYTGGLGEVALSVSQVTISFPNGTTFTGRISTPKNGKITTPKNGKITTPEKSYIKYIFGIGFLVGAYIILKKKRGN